ncbi:MAG: ester cyclase [Actinomycetota bacterium]|nr:ester cyclase [Actinomycetota bacterium]
MSGRAVVTERYRHQAGHHHGVDAACSRPRPQGALDDCRDVMAVSNDARYEIDDIVAAVDTVPVRWTGYLPHTGTIAGVEPTGRKLTLPGMSFYKVRNGQIVETCNQVDMLGLLTHWPSSRAAEASPAPFAATPGDPYTRVRAVDGPRGYSSVG